MYDLSGGRRTGAEYAEISHASSLFFCWKEQPGQRLRLGRNAKGNPSGDYDGDRMKRIISKRLEVAAAREVLGFHRYGAGLKIVSKRNDRQQNND